MLNRRIGLRQRLIDSGAFRRHLVRRASGRTTLGSLIIRARDLVIASALLALTFPLLLFVAVAIKCDCAGPVFERQENGEDGRRFILLTFRTTSYPEYVPPKWDRRLTWVGWFLRYSHIDALPQLLNVIRGDISLFQGRVERDLLC